MTSQRPCWCPKKKKKKKWRPCWCPKLNLWQLNSVFMQIACFVSVKQYGCKPLVWKLYLSVRPSNHPSSYFSVRPSVRPSIHQLTHDVLICQSTFVPFQKSLYLEKPIYICSQSRTDVFYALRLPLDSKRWLYTAWNSDRELVPNATDVWSTTWMQWSGE